MRYALLAALIAVPGAALLATAGCSLIEPPRAAPGTPLRACEDAADASPNLHDFAATQGSNASPSSFTPAYLAARKQLVAECMAVRQGLPIGGVEKPIR